MIELIDPPPAPRAAAPMPVPDIAALRRGDAAAFSEIVRRHGPMVAGVCQSMGLRGADADDATAEAFAAVFRALPSFAARSQLSTWIYRIAFRQVLHAAQRRRARRHQELSPANEPADARQLPAGAAMEAAELRERLWAIVGTLEPRQAMAVDLFYRRGLDVGAVAGVLECPVNTVKTLLSRARQRLRIVLEKQGITS